MANISKIRLPDSETPIYIKDANTAGLKVTGTTYTYEDVNGQTQTGTADTGAEIFNVYGTNQVTDTTVNVSLGTNSHAEGSGNVAAGAQAHAEGLDNKTFANNSHIENSHNIIETGSGSSHCEGGHNHIYASAQANHIEGLYNKIMSSAQCNHCEGRENEVSASVNYAHAEGYGTIAQSNFQHVQGKFNKGDDTGGYAFILGNGTGVSYRSNALAIGWDGEMYQNNSTISIQDGIRDLVDSGSKNLVINKNNKIVTMSGLTFTKNSDGSITVTGTLQSTGEVIYTICSFADLHLEPDKYYMGYGLDKDANGNEQYKEEKPSGSEAYNACFIGLRASNYNNTRAFFNDSRPFTSEDSSQFSSLIIYIKNKTSTPKTFNITFHPMICLRGAYAASTNYVQPTRMYLCKTITKPTTLTNITDLDIPLLPGYIYRLSATVNTVGTLQLRLNALNTDFNLTGEITTANMGITSNAAQVHGTALLTLESSLTDAKARVAYGGSGTGSVIITFIVEQLGPIY